MKTRSILFLLFAAAALALVPAAALAESATHTYELEMEAPNFAEAPNDDRVAVTGGGEFGVHPKFVDASGEFSHMDSAGNVLAEGTWTATKLLTYQSYGCGVVFGTDIPDNLCGGRVKMRVLLSTPIGELPGILTVFCVIGPNPPNSAVEGVTLNVPGVINFNHSAGGENVYIQTS